MRLNEIIEIPEHYKYLAADHRLQLTQELFDMFKFVEKIKKDCQPFLQQLNNEPFNSLPLYRGLSGEDNPTGTNRVRLGNRKPSDTPLQMHQMIQGYFKKHYGEAFRSAMFCTGSESTASEYGDYVYRIFPIGNFTFLWSKEIEDLYSILPEYDLDHINDDLLPTERAKLIQNFKKEVLSTYQTTDLIGAVKSNHEVMIRVPSYYFVREDYITYNHEKAYTELLKS